MIACEIDFLFFISLYVFFYTCETWKEGRKNKYCDMINCSFLEKEYFLAIKVVQKKINFNHDGTTYKKVVHKTCIGCKVCKGIKRFSIKGNDLYFYVIPHQIIYP